MALPTINLTGQTFGRLTVIDRANRSGDVAWNCQCSCGRSRVVLAYNLKNGNSKGCGSCNRAGRVKKCRPLEERLLARIRYDHGCWDFTGRISPDGYGRISVGRKYEGHLNAHRAAYLCFVGPLTSEQHVDHLCRNRRCCNPLHLEAVSFQENIRRGARHRSAS